MRATKNENANALWRPVIIADDFVRLDLAGFPSGIPVPRTFTTYLETTQKTTVR